MSKCLIFFYLKQEQHQNKAKTKPTQRMYSFIEQETADGESLLYIIKGTEHQLTISQATEEECSAKQPPHHH